MPRNHPSHPSRLRMEFMDQDCPCTLPACPFFIAEQRLARLDPRAAVRELAKESPTSPFTLKVAMAALVDAQYRRAGAGTAFMGQLSHRSTGDRPHWDYPLRGIISIFTAIYRDSDAPRQGEDADVLKDTVSKYPVFVEAITRDFHFLTPADKMGDYRRCTVGGALLFFIDDPATKLKMYEEQSLRLIVHCWLETSPDYPLRHYATNVLVEVIVKKALNGSQPPPDYLERVFKLVKIPHLMSRLNFLFKSRKLADEMVWHEVQVVVYLTWEWQPFSPHVVEANVPKNVLAAIRRTLKNNARPFDEVENLFGQVEILAQNLFDQSPNTMHVLTGLVKNTYLVEVAAEGLKRANRSTEPVGNLLDRPGYFYRFFSHIINPKYVSTPCSL
ncbi:unnamed protein product [Cyclocybe aegerita]|uniref:Uncharacterized protein n=1 Tax=Cyclocybe aegerita TaxID=1973307 RepID=A0A8S0VT73_CYCAE|nr:unnamed protein product [Cyclocybe aegerita]